MEYSSKGGVLRPAAPILCFLAATLFLASLAKGPAIDHLIRTREYERHLFYLTNPVMMQAGEGFTRRGRRVLRPAALILCFLAATAFLASHKSHPKFDFNTLLYKPNNASPLLGNKPINTSESHLSWPNRDVWVRLSREPRLPYNRCSYAQCPISSDWSQSQFAHPFNVEDVCPFYFSYIHEDLAPWAPPYDAKDHPHANDHLKNVNLQENDGSIVTGISKEMLDKAISLADFRVVIKRGKLFVDAYRACFQTRAIFTIWGLLQLLKFYPGLVPDVDMLFGCEDTPQVSKTQYKKYPPPPVFRYCTTINNFDIPFPDWSFWGWPEIDLKAWEYELTDILIGENDLLWEQRRPTAFWKGNTNTGGKLRKDLKSCNGAEIIHQDWRAAAKAHYKNSRLAQQCNNRYKIYVEGRGWSVSLKYIMACDSPVLLVDPLFHDFFSRGLEPMKHFWPIGREKLCDSIKFGVEWGNNNTLEAETLGRSGRQFITKEVSMKHVYDYMLHALHEYAKLLRFEPMAGEQMREVCADEMVCQAPEKERALYEESMVRQASGRAPCFLGPRDKKLMEARLQQRASMRKLVQEAEHAGNWSAAHIIDTPL